MSALFQPLQAGALLLPYLAWVGFAACPTWAVSRANPHWL